MNLDYIITKFANSFVGQNPLIDGLMWQLCANCILSTVPLTALLVFLWNRNASDLQRMRLLAGAVAIGTSGLVSRILQKMLPIIGSGRTRPLYDPNLTGIIHWPIGLPPHAFEGQSSWPSDTAAWVFGLVLLIWLNGGKRLGIPALCLAAFSSLMRIPMGIHFLSDILCGAALGLAMVLASQRLPIPRVAFQILKVQRKWPVAFCAAMFLATYSLATFAEDLRTLAGMIYADLPGDAGRAAQVLSVPLSPKFGQGPDGSPRPSAKAPEEKTIIAENGRPRLICL
jgi:membrane-associated phospholipid phosphatase